MQGDVIEKGTTTLGINRAGFTLHSAIHQARPDLKCVIHLHTPAAVAVSPRPVSVDSVFDQCCTGNDFKSIVNWHWYMSRVYEFIKRNSNKSKDEDCNVFNMGLCCTEAVVQSVHWQLHVYMQTCHNLYDEKKYHCTCTGINIWYFCCRCLHWNVAFCPCHRKPLFVVKSATTNIMAY